MCASYEPASACVGNEDSNMPIGSSPGCTLKTLTPTRFVSCARFSVNFRTEAFDTEYADISGHRYAPA